MDHRFAVLGVAALALSACGQPGTTGNSNPAGAEAGSGGGNTASGGAGGSGGSDGGTAGADTGPGPGSVACGATSWPDGNQVLYALDVAGTQREFIVTIPENYDPAHPYRLVFAWHDRGVTAAQLAASFNGSGFYGLAGQIGDSTILVSPRGLGTEDDPEVAGWANVDGRDIAFVRELVEWMNESYCIDQSRIFSTGMSDGGNLSIAIGCELSDVFRGVAVIAGALPAEAGESCSPGPLAVWQVHGTADEMVPIAEGERARDAFVAGNHCVATTHAVMPDGCVSYDGCDAGYPVVWCAYEGGGHSIPSFASAYIGSFFEHL